MRLLLDENIPKPTEDALRAWGHDILHAPARTKDDTLAKVAEVKRLIVVTHDSDFLSFLPSTRTGIIVIRIHPPVAEPITQALKRLFEAHRPQWFRGKIVILRREGYELVR